MEENEELGTFRDRLSTISEEGQRLWVYPKRPKGRLYNWRWVLSGVLLAFFFLGPFIRINGDPLLLLNIFERKFVIFGVIFWPQDFYLLLLTMITSIVFIVLFTVIYGRLFCGWICPQTIFMEFAYRQVEYLIEGNHSKQRKFDNQPWNFEKVWKKTLKHLVFLLISFLSITTFLNYLIGVDSAREFFRNGFSAHVAGYIGLFVFTLLHYLVFAKFREQVCIIVCPYGRLQGVLLDKNTINITYDYKRGEPRGKHNPLAPKTESRGDCIDCSSCTLVCPTGIDIRNGTQLECINCAACIDACDAIMERVNKPKGLIRYASERSIAEGTRLKLNGRVVFYSVILSGLLILVGYLFTIRTDVEATILRVQGTLFQDYDADHYSNIYNCQVINKTRVDLPVEILVENEGAEIKLLGDPLVVKRGEPGQVRFLLVMPKSVLEGSQTDIEFKILSNGKEVDEIESSFVGPNSLDK